jgi:mRNA interferase MazF
VKQGELWYADLDPTKGSEQAGYRPLLIISGNLLNQYLPVVICFPLTTKVKNYKGNLVLEPGKTNGLKKKSEVLTFHIRSISKDRLKKRIGHISAEQVKLLKSNLNEILTY